MPRKRKLPEGMFLRNRVYWCDFRANGRRIRKSLATDFDAACEILVDLRSRAHKAEFGLLTNDYALANLQKEWLTHCRQTLKPASTRRYQECLESILPALGATRVSQLRPEAILAYRTERLVQGLSPRTINMHVGALQTMVRWAVKLRLCGTNPLTGIEPLPNNTPKSGRALTNDEVARLLDKSPQPWRDLWYAYLVTGCRKEELGQLKFRDIDWATQELIIRSEVAKNHRERRIPIEPGLMVILKRQESEREARTPKSGRTPAVTARLRSRFTKDHVFVTSSNTPTSHRSRTYKIFLACCKIAGIEIKTIDSTGRLIEHVDLHSLRRTFATSLISGGADPKSVQELLGHRTLDMTMRIYAKIHSGTKRQALDALSYTPKGPTGQQPSQEGK